MKEVNKKLLSSFSNSTDLVVIFLHNASLITIDPRLDDDVFNIDEPLLDEYDEWEKSEDAMPLLFFEKMQEALTSGKSIAVLNYNPFVASCMKLVVEYSKTNFNTDIICLTFFHDDEETRHLYFDGIPSVLDLKFQLIENMLDYPFIKKFIVPFNYEINVPFLTKLFKEMF